MPTKDSDRISVIVVSKPLEKPWTDSSKNLARDIVLHSSRTDYAVFSDDASAFPGVRRFRGGRSSYAPSLWQNLRLFVRLLFTRADIYHFFFAPNPLTCAVLGWLMKFKSARTVHTLCSRPLRYDGLGQILFADRVIALSEETTRQLAEQGIRATHIPPFISHARFAPGRADLSRWSDLRKNADTVILYPGDYEYTGGHDVLVRCLPELAKRRIRVVFACRNKTDQAKRIEADVREAVRRAGTDDMIRFLNEVDDMPSLIEACDFTVFPAASLYRKMDIPLVLMESMALERPVIVSGLASLKELVDSDSGHVVEDLSPERWTQAIVSLSADRALRTKMGKHGRFRIESRFSSEVWTPRYEQLYRELCAPSDSRPYYDAFSRSYENNRRSGYHALIDDLESEMVAGHVAGKTALEVGCGTGLILERLRQTAASLTGIDISDGMLDKARAKGFSVRVGSATDIPFGEASFDVVYSFKVLAHVQDIRKALSEMARVTKPGGTILAEFYNRNSVRGARWLLRKAISKIRGNSAHQDETSIFTRYDSPSQIESYLPKGVRLVERRGVIVWTPLAWAHRIPVVGGILRWAERHSTQDPLARLGGFYVVVLRKEGGTTA